MAPRGHRKPGGQKTSFFSHLMGKMTELAPVLGRSLAIVAHPDDECIAFGALLQRIAEQTVVYCTDGAPQDPYFWKEKYGSREKYIELRKSETLTALEHVGVHRPVFLADADSKLVDQELFRNIPLAFSLLAELIERLRPEALLTLAYEGGHPDHDTCSFLTSVLARHFGLPAYEAPLYHRARSEGAERIGVQRFIHAGIPVLEVRPTEEELRRKRLMCEAYGSQGDFLRIFDIGREVIRRQAEYDYRIPPHAGKLNYEIWEWQMTGREVCAAFSDFLFSLAQQGFSGEKATGDSGADSNVGRSESI